MKSGPRVAPFGDAAVLVSLGERVDVTLNRQVLAIAGSISQLNGPGWGSIVPAYASLLVHVDVRAITLDEACRAVEQLVDAELSRPSDVEADEVGEVVRIPVAYGGADGPDLDEVAALTGMSADDVVGLHAGTAYRVFMLGFAPGFAYLGPLDRQLVVPRRSEPRVSVPAGSVGIGGWQTAVYPVPSPGGLRIIGRTDLRLWDVGADPPARLQPGMRVQFVPQ